MISEGKLDIIEYRVGKRLSGHVIHDIKEIIKRYIVSIYRRDGTQITTPSDNIVLRENRPVLIGLSEDFDKVGCFIEE